MSGWSNWLPWRRRGDPSPLVEATGVSVSETVAPDDDAAQLFQRAFRQTIPAVPRHFLLRHEAVGSPAQLLGYVHFTPFRDSFLAGGLVVDAWRFRALPAHAQAAVRQRGGMAQWLMTDGCARLNPCHSVFAYIGDKRSILVNERVGFRFTGHPYLYVLPGKKFKDAGAGDDVTLEVVKLGPF